MRTVFILVMLILAAMAAGCWDRKEPIDMVYAVALGFDVDDEGHYVAIAQLANPMASKSSNGGGSRGSGLSSYSTFAAKGHTPSEAVFNIEPSLSREMARSNVEVVLLSGRLARSGIGPIIDFLSRDYQIRLIASCAVVDGDLGELLCTELPLDSIPALSIQRMLDPIHFSDPSPVLPSILRGIACMLRPGQDLILPVLKLDSGSDDGETEAKGLRPARARVSHIGAAVFRGDRMVGWLDGSEARGSNFAMNASDRVPLHIESPAGGLIGVLVTRVQSRVIPTYKDGRVSILVRVRAEGRVQDQTGLGPGRKGIDFDDEESIRQLRARLAQCIREDIEHAIEKSKHYCSDFMGFGNAVYRKLPQVWMSYVGSRWYDLLPNLDVEVQVEAELTHSGLLRDGLSF